VPKVLRKLFERERRLLSVLPRCADASIEALLREAVDDRHARIGTVASIQTFGSYAANFHPHVHALITEGAFHVLADGVPEFERVQWWDSKALNELFRRMVLRALRKAERLRPETEQTLLGWQGNTPASASTRRSRSCPTTTIASNTWPATSPARRCAWTRSSGLKTAA
jgi:hypothetical protein